MGVTIGDVDAFMPDALGDGDGGKSHFNQQGNVAVSKSWNLILNLYYTFSSIDETKS